MITIYAACISACLGAVIAYGQLDLPRPAWHSEVEELKEQVVANAQLLLGDKWLRLTAQIKQLQAQIARDPSNRELIERLVILQLQLRAVNSKLK